MQIVAMNEDDMADGSGKAPLTFIAKEQLTSAHKMNSYSTTSGGWAATDMRTYLHDTILPLIPEAVAAQIKPVTKRTWYYNGDANTLSTEDIWIPSEYEVGGTGRETEGAKYAAAFKDNSTRIRERAGTASHWWLRSAASRTYFRFVAAAGKFNDISANSGYGVVLGFCLGASVETGEISDSWSDILAAESDGTYSTKYALGDTKVMYLDGEPVRMQIAAMGGNADPLADGSGNAKIAWVSKYLLEDSHRMNPSKIAGTEGTGALGGWEKSEMRTYLRETIFPDIPAVIRDAIKEVTKYTNI